MAADKEVIQLNGKTFIYYSNKGLVYRHPTKIQWKERSLPHNKELMDILVKKVRDAISEYRKNNGINPPRDFIRSTLRGEETTEQKNLLDSYIEFLSHKKDQVNNGKLQPNSMVDFNSLKSALLAFEKHSKTEFHLSDINEDFIGRFKEYLISVRELSSNTTQKRINSLKVFMKYCEDFRVGYTSIP
jgi:hypothetical protein